jgi:O-antigen/teichoic acid export membrane protein
VVGQRAGLAPVTRRAAGRSAVSADPGSAGAQPAGGAVALDVGALARRSSMSVLGSVFSSVANVALVVAVTRGVDQRTAGLFFTATSLFLLLEIGCRLGTTTGLVYFIPRYRVTGQAGRLGPLLRTALVPVLVVSVAVGAVLALAAPLLGRLIGGDSGELDTSLRVLAAFLPVAALYDSVTAATRGYQSMRPTILVERVGRPLGQLVLVVGAIGLGSAALLVPAWSLPYLLGLVSVTWSLRRLHRATPGAGPLVRPPREMSREYWRYTGPRILANVAQIALQRMDIVLVGALRGPRDAAIYAAVTRFLVVGQLGSQAVSLVVQPTLAELLATKDLRGTKVLYQISTAWLIALTWPLYLLSAVLAPQLVGLFGNGYAAGSPVIVVLAIAMLVATGCGMVDMMLTMAGKTSWNLGNVLLALSVNIVLDLLLIPRYGVLGAGIAWAVAIVLNNLVPLAQVGWLLRVHPLGRQALTVMAAAGVCFGLLPLLARTLSDSPVALAAAAVLGAVGYLALLVRLRRLLRLDELLRRRRGKGQRGGGGATGGPVEPPRRGGRRRQPGRARRTGGGGRHAAGRADQPAGEMVARLRSVQPAGDGVGKGVTIPSSRMS